MNALNVLSLVVAVANAHLVPRLLPYTHNLLHTTSFRAVAGAPVHYTLANSAPVKYTLAAGAAPFKYTLAAAPTPLAVAAPAPVAYTTAALAPAVVAPTTRTSQYHSQDELGQYSFGYSGGTSSRNEVRDAFGVVRGSYNYIDANGKVQHQSYISDALGFRVAATNLPVAPDTSARRKRSVGSVAIHSAVSPLHFPYGFNAVHPYNFRYTAPALTYTARHAVAPAVTYAAAPAVTFAAAAAPAVTYAAGHAVTPVTYAAAAPAVAATYDAKLLRVENNPGHAVSYRVY